MRKIFTYFILVLISFYYQKVNAQCPVNQDSVTITVQTENHAFGIYWQLVPDTNHCGVNPIFIGGNTTQLNCNSAGINISTAVNGYTSNTTYVEGPWCLNRDSVYSIRYIEDRGGYDNIFTVNINGYPVYNFFTSGIEHKFSFTVTPPLAYDAEIRELNLTSYMQPISHNISGSLFNYSANTITAIDLYYSVNGGTPIVQSLGGLNITPFTSYNFSHNIPWNPAIGTYNVKAWCENLNGNADMNNNNDTISKSVAIGDSIPNVISNYLNYPMLFNIMGDASDLIYFPSDLDFHTILTKNELWVVNMGDEMTNGSTVTFYNAGKPTQVSLWRQDPSADHFMYLPASISFGDNTYFATADAVLDAHHNSGHFAGPALWDSDTLIYARPGVGPLGSHIDMLHQSPFAMGVTDEHENKYWVYDGYNQRITSYDFVEPHAPGEDEHGDGLVRRYDDIVLQRINDTIPNHLILDKNSGWLYVVDNGNARVVRMDINTGTVTGTFPNYQEPLSEHSIVTGTTWNNFITTGLVQPAGIDIVGNRLIVSDYSNGDIIIYDCSGTTGQELGRIHTGTPGVAGVKIGPDGKIWYVNQLLNTLVRVNPVLPVGLTKSETKSKFNVYPNPSNQFSVFSFQSTNYKNYSLKVFDVMGKIIYSQNHLSENIKLQTANWESGIYFVQLATADDITIQKLVVQH